MRAGVDGLVCSPREAEALPAPAGAGLLLCTPGIRPAGAETGDQARAETPAFAIRAGAICWWWAGPSTRRRIPVAAARAIAEEVSAA